MTPTIVSPAARFGVAGAKPPAHFGRTVWLIAAMASVLLVLLNIFWRESYTGDDGFYGVTAQNMLRSPTYILRPSFFPAGDFDADKGGFAHPPFNSYYYAVALAVSRGSLAGPEIAAGLAFLALLGVVYVTVARFDRLAAGLSVLLLAASPAILEAYSELEAEPLLVVTGIAGLYCCFRGNFDQGRRGWLFLGGLGLGLSFALKLWLFGPAALAVAAVLAVEAWEARAWSDLGKGVLLFVIGLVLPAGAHLLAIAWFHPADLGFWLKEVYFGLFTQSGISGGKLTAEGIPSNWVHPIWYYGAALYRDEFFLLPPIVFGAGSLVRDTRLSRRLLFAVLAGIAGLAPLSLIKVKEPLYVLTCAVLLYVLAGMCLAALVRRIETKGDLDRPSLWAGTVITAGFLVGVLAAYLRHVQPDKLTPAFVIAHTATFAFALAVVVWSRRRKSGAALQWAVAGGCAVAVIALATWNRATERPRDVTIARVIEPYIAANSPSTLSLIATNFRCYEYYTFRRGLYWHELPPGHTPAQIMAEPRFRQVRAFILGPEDQAIVANQGWLAWLRENATDITGEIDHRLGGSTGYRVFVRGSGAGNVARSK